MIIINRYYTKVKLLKHVKRTIYVRPMHVQWKRYNYDLFRVISEDPHQWGFN